MSLTRRGLDALRNRAPTAYWRTRNAVALVEMYAARARRRRDEDADAYDDAFWTFHATGDWDGFARVVREYVPVRSLVDLGCGQGLALAAFVRADPTVQARGFDDSAAALRRARAQGLTVDQLDIVAIDRRVAATIARGLAGTDLAVCLEVAEHLPRWHASKLLTIASAANHLVFSAAHPNQGGRLHVNEQPAEYWIARLEQYRHRLDARDDRFRRDVAALDLPSWYARNIHLFAREV